MISYRLAIYTSEHIYLQLLAQNLFLLNKYTVGQKNRLSELPPREEIILDNE